MKFLAGASLSDAGTGWRRWLTGLALSLCLVCSAWAEGIQLADTRIDYVADAGDPAWHLSAGYRIDLGQRLEDAVNRGLPLIFVSEVEVSRPRWYWFNEKTVTITQVFRLSFTPLTQQYRISTGSLSQRFDTLNEALGMMSRISRMRLGGRNDLKIGEQYEVAMRLRLDLTQLPKPFQVNAMTNREWNLNSDWKRQMFVALPDTSNP